MKGIVSNLIGGLGNQLFQFACGQALAWRSGLPLSLALDQFEAYRLHQGYELARVFTVQVPTAPPEQLQALLGFARHPLARRLLARLAPGRRLGGRAWFEPADGRFLPGVLQNPGPAYLHGYWQSERYFADAQAPLRALLQFRQAPSPLNAQWLARISACTAVSLHLRRGDYVSNPKNQRIYAVCTPEYYRAAMDRLLGAHPQANFFVFSDEPAWAREVLAGRREPLHFIEHNRHADSWNDLRLMSHCQHHVIANSSFSWWGAWLGQRAGQVVVAPQRWFVDPDRGADIVPASWERL